MKILLSRITLICGMGFVVLGNSTAIAQTVQWINHLDLIAGDASVTQASYASTQDFGLIIRSTTVGDVDSSGGNKVVSKALQIPSNSTITGIRLCYALSDTRSFVSAIRLSQVQAPESATILLDSPLRGSEGPVCVDSNATSIDPSLGALILDLRVNFGDTADRITVRSLGIITK